MHDKLKQFLTLPKAQFGITVTGDPIFDRYGVNNWFSQVTNQNESLPNMVYDSNTGQYRPSISANLPSAGNTPYTMQGNNQNGILEDYEAQGMGNAWMAQNQPSRALQTPISTLQAQPMVANAPFGSNYANTLLSQSAQNASQELVNPNTTTQPQQFNGINLFNPFGGNDPLQGLAYGLYNFGAGNNAQGALGIGRGLLGAARLGFSAYGAGRSQRDLLNRQNNNPQVNSTFLQNGGFVIPRYKTGGEVSVAEFLSGKYTTDSSNPTAEIERGEYVLNSQNGIISEAVGETHENGGIKTNLPNGSKVLSDHTKIGAKNAKELSKELDIKVKAKNTFADVLDKYSKKIGVEKNIKENEKLVENIEETLRMEQTDTKEINMNFLEQENQRIEQEKQKLNSLQQTAFETIFDKQEAQKGNVMMQDGGQVDPATQEEQMNPNDIVVQVQQMMAQGATVEEVLNGLLSMGYSEDQVSQIIQASQAQQQPQMQQGGIARYYSPLEVNTGNFGRQAFTRGVNLSVSPEEALRRLQMQYQSLPNLIDRTGLGVDNMTGITEDGSRFGQFQVGYNNYLDKAVDAINLNPNISDTEKKQLLERLQTERFGEGIARDFDQIYGDFTSSRSGVMLPALTKADRYKYGTSIKRIGDVVTPEGNIKPEFADLSEGAKKYIQDVVKKGGQPTYDIGLLDIDAPTNPTTQVQTQNPTQQQQIQNNNNTSPQRRIVVPLIPTIEGLPPSAALIPRNDQVNFNRIQPVIRTPEASIAAINSQANFLNEQSFLSNPNLAPFLTATNLGTTQQSVNRAIAETDAYNAEAINRANQYNTQVGDKEQLMNINLAQNYEQRLFKTLDNQEQDWNRFLINRQVQNKQNWMDINNLNLTNAMFPNYQTDGSNVYFQNPRNYGKTQQELEMEKYYNNLTPQQRAQVINQYKQDGGYVYEDGLIPLTDEATAQAVALTGFTPEFAREYFRLNGEQTQSVPNATVSLQRQPIDLSTNRIADITSGTNRYTPDGGVIVGDYKKVWINNRPEYFTGKTAPVEGTDFTYLSAQDFLKFKQSDNYKNYRAGYPNKTVASKF